MLLQERSKLMSILFYFIIATFTTQSVLSKTEGRMNEVPKLFGQLDLIEDYPLEKNNFRRYGKYSNIQYISLECYFFNDFKFPACQKKIGLGVKGIFLRKDRKRQQKYTMSSFL